MPEPFFILVADDDENDVWIMRRAMQRAQILDPFHFVRDGEEAIDYLGGRGDYKNRKLHPLPALAIFDIKMPRKSGLEALEWARQQKHLKNVPILILSSSAERRDINRAYEIGANAYLIKPSQMDELGAMLKHACNFWKKTASFETTARK